MNDDKLLKLAKLVSPTVQLKNLHRLVDGDLADLGDALLRGEEVRFVDINGTYTDCDFSAVRDYYTIVTPRITVGNASFSKPVTEPLNVGDTFWVVSVVGDHNVMQYEWRNHGHNYSCLRLGLVHRTKEAAMEHARALSKINRGEF